MWVLLQAVGQQDTVETFIENFRMLMSTSPLILEEYDLVVLIKLTAAVHPHPVLMSRGALLVFWIVRVVIVDYLDRCFITLIYVIG